MFQIDIIPLRVVFIGVVISVVLLMRCKNTPIINSADVSVEVNKRFAARRNCSCAAYALADGDKYDAYIIEKKNNVKKSRKIKFSDEKNYLPQSVSHDCRYLSIAASKTNSERTDLVIYDISNNSKNILTTSESHPSNFSTFSPVDNKLAYISNGEIHIYDLSTKQTKKIASPENKSFKYLTWSSKGKFIFAEDKETDIWEYRTQNGSFRLIWKAPKLMQGYRFITPSENDDDLFYFISDHESQFKQIYKYQQGEVRQIFNSNFDKLLLQRPVINGYLYYRSNEYGNYKLKRLKDSIEETILDHGVIYDYAADFGGSGIATYTNQYIAPSLFEIKKDYAKNLLEINKPDSLPLPQVFINKDKACSFIYQPKISPKGWAIWLHGGPKEQFSNRYFIWVIAMVKAGYGVIALNYPGSIGFGHDYEAVSLSPSELLKKEVSGMREDIVEIKEKYHIASYAIVGLSYGTFLGRAYVSKYEKEVSKFIEIAGLNITPNYNPKIPILYVYGEQDFAMKNEQRLEMMNKTRLAGNSKELQIKGEGHVILKRENIAVALNAINKFLDR
ncbi:alpha/beta hydrolase family protein [Mucilaginibacter aquaedulcis]|uniref:alpha/beta hydrolase family protein n=1 Tax=Mucilaginibacter aquaedulcis TaxID=1187081 RepID=UPI0025B48EE6|nr:alpha/beta fold hydrolase [Mucilaginibacter aquaedulcis]MDN3548816.1 alpha/beta fold hydrolase [Mucilaginibacter aquaedulcis]